MSLPRIALRWLEVKGPATALVEEGTHLLPMSQDVEGLGGGTHSKAPVREAEQEL